MEGERFSCGHNETLEGIVSTWDGGERYPTLSSEPPSPLSLSEMSFFLLVLAGEIFFYWKNMETLGALYRVR